MSEHAPVTVRVLYHQEPQGWWAESPDLDGWSVAGETYDEVRRLAGDGIRFALASVAEDRGDVFDEADFESVKVEHDLALPA
jgi:predicted RNase H-like HicB family nuclease